MNTVVIGVGNAFRQDDGVGIRLLRQVREALPPAQAKAMRFVEANGEGLALIDAWHGCNLAVIFDAVMARGEPGRLLHLSAQMDRFPADFFKYSSHAFSLAEAVELARTLDLLPAHLHVFGVEGSRFGYGEELSAEVARGCERLVRQIITGQWLCGQGPASAGDPYTHEPIR